MTLLIPELNGPGGPAMSSIRRGARLRVPTGGGPAPMKPAAPALNSATGGDSLAVLDWTPGGDGGSPITGFHVLRGFTADALTLLAAVGVVDTYTDHTAANGVRYFYGVEAVNAVGVSVASNVAQALPQPAVIPVPVNVAAGAVATAGPLNLNSTADVPQGSTLLVTVALSFSAPPDSIVVTDPNGNAYTFDVNDLGNSYQIARTVTAGGTDLPTGSAFTITPVGGATTAIVATIDAIVSANLIPDIAVPVVPTPVASNHTHQINAVEVAGDLMYGADVAFGAEALPATTAAPFTQLVTANTAGHPVCTAYELPVTNNAVSYSNNWPSSAHSGAMSVIPYKLAVAA